MMSLLNCTSGIGLARCATLVAATLVVSATSVMAQQTVTIKGIVTDAKKEPLIGVNVRVQGATIGTATDLDGKFVLAGVAPNAVLECSYVGMKTLLVPVNGQSTISILMQDDANQLSDVVVVGYGVQRKVNLTGSVSAVKGEALERRPVANATQSLQGLVPGLTVNNSSSGRPGAAASLSLRGQGNLSGNAAPYILVDGVEMNLADVNPNDIESISVLKDAAASAIYGARAAYGVVLVTTKRGQEGKMNISYQGTTGWSAPTVLPKMVDSRRFAQFWNDGVTNTGANRLYKPEKLALLEQFIADPSSVNPWQELPPNATMNPAFENSESGIGNTNYFDLHYKDWAFKHNHNLSLSGGGKAAQYYVSGGFYNEEGLLRHADIDYTRYNLASNLNSELTSWLKLKLNTKFMHAISNTPFGNGGLSEGFYHSLARFRPTVHHTDPNGRYTELSMVPYLRSGTYTRSTDSHYGITGGIELKPLNNWHIFFDYTFKGSHGEYEALNKAPLIYGANGSSTTLGARSELGVVADGRFTRGYTRSYYQSMNAYTNYLFSLGEQHNFTLLAGFQQEENRFSSLYNSITGLYSTTNPSVAMGSGDKGITDVRYSWATRGFFGRINYDYDGKYLLELNGRYDGSSRFAPGSRWGFFPSASLGWNISREKFMEPLRDVLSHLKLRLSYGLLGNQAGASLYTFASTMSLNGGLGSYIFPDGRHIYTNAPEVINPYTTWEKVDNKNIGIDFSLWSGALSGSIDIFQRETRDMLGKAEELPDIFGATPPPTNNARMRNRGWELTLNYRGRIGKEIDYSIGGMLSDATSVVTAYGSVARDGKQVVANPASNWYQGRKVGEIWGYRADGIIQTQAEADEYNAKHNLTHLSGRPWTPGDLKYRDLNRDGKINYGTNVLGDMGDMEVIGNTTPRYQYSINGSISWRKLSLSFMLQGVAKRDWSPNGVYFWASGPFAQVTVFEEHMDYWRPDNPGAYYPKPYIHNAGAIGGFTAKTMTTSDLYLQNAAYCRLKNLSLSYELPTSWSARLGLRKVQVFFSGENLLTITPLKGMFDPEAIFTGSAYSSEGGKNYPMNKVLSMGLIVNL